MRTALAATVIALVLAPVSAAASPLVPLIAQVQIKSVLGVIGIKDMAYVPTRGPASYIYASDTVQPTQVQLVLESTKGPKGARPFATFIVQYLKGSCAKGNEVTLKLGGSNVYTKGTNAWRCLRASTGKTLKLSANGVGLSRGDLGNMVAYAKRIP